MARPTYEVPGDASGPARPVFLVDAHGEMVRSAHPLAVQLVNAELDVEIGEVVTVSAWAPNGAQADQALTVDATAGGVQFAAFHADTTQVFWDCQDAPCRVTFDGSAPTTTNGHLIQPGDSGIWTKALAAAAKFIRTGATSGLIHASQLKEA